MPIGVQWMHDTIQKIEGAIHNPLSDWEMKFLHSMLERLERFGTDSNITDNQHRALHRILTPKKARQQSHRASAATLMLGGQLSKQPSGRPIRKLTATKISVGTMKVIHLGIPPRELLNDTEPTPKKLDLSKCF